jgi:hypothetical protein
MSATDAGSWRVIFGRASSPANRLRHARCGLLTISVISPPTDRSISHATVAVETAIRRPSGPIQAPVDLVTAAIETSGGVIPAGVCGSVGTRVQPFVDSIALTIQPLLDSITVPIGAIFDPVA